jgi:bacillithiol biosynthesis cysteine-adding enzyme BshC
MVHSIALRDIPSTTRLLADFWEAREGIRSLVPRHFTEPGAFVEQAKLLRAGSYDRKGLAAALLEQNMRFGSGPAALANVKRLEDPAATVVIGGQQAGLFGGPLYTVNKALTILLLARHMEAELGAPVIPVFWIASEDSDLAEVDHAHLTDRDGVLRALRLPGAGVGKVPVSRIRLGEAIGPMLDELAALLPDAEHTEELLSAVRAAYTPGRTYPQAFGAWMAWLFRDHGIVLVDPSDDKLKRIAQPLFEREIREKSPVSAAVIGQTERLVKAGYPVQIELRPGYLTLFHQDPSRDAILVKDAGFELKASGRRFTTDELAAVLRASPGTFTPNAVLRPLFEDTLFPSLAVVLGPSELAYFSELTLAYDRMGIAMPLMFPRSSLTLVEPKVEKLRTKLDVGFTQVLARGEHIIDDILRREIPASLTARITDSRIAVADAWRGIVGEIDRLDPTLHRTAVIGSSRALRQFDFIDRKIAQAARKKNAILRGQVGRLVAAIAPRGGLQERTLCALPFLARHGRDILPLMLDAMDPFSSEHRALVVER